MSKKTHDAELDVTLKFGGEKKRFTIPVTLGERLEASVECELRLLEEEVVEEVSPEKTSSAALYRLRLHQKLTQKQLADRVGIRQHHLSEMENGKRVIGKEMAKKLANVLNANWRILV